MLIPDCFCLNADELIVGITSQTHMFKATRFTLSTAGPTVQLLITSLPAVLALYLQASPRTSATSDSE